MKDFEDSYSEIAELERRLILLQRRFHALKNEVLDEIDIEEVEHFLKYGAGGNDPED